MVTDGIIRVRGYVRVTVIYWDRGNFRGSDKCHGRGGV